MDHRLGRDLIAASCAALVIGVAAPAWAGPMTAYLNTPTGLSPIVSNGSLVLADDFVPSVTGGVHFAYWWGSEAPVNRWVVAMYSNVAGHPSNIGDPIVEALFRLSLPDVDQVFDPNTGLWKFTVDLKGIPVELSAGTEYWFSVSNLSPGWQWATSGSTPSVGTESFGGQMTDRLGPDCPDECYAPWSATGSNFAFGVVLPEPGSLPLVALALGVVGALGLRTRRSASARKQAD